MLGRGRDPFKDLAETVNKEFQRQGKRIAQLEQHLSAHSLALGTTQKQECTSNMSSLRDQEQHYVQLILLVGYAGVFTLWVQTRQDMSDWMFASTGALITISLFFFVGFELYKALVVGKALAALKSGDYSVDVHNNAAERVNKHWYVCFAISAGTGVLAGVSLLLWFVYRTIMAAYGWI